MKPRTFLILFYCLILSACANLPKQTKAAQLEEIAETEMPSVIPAGIEFSISFETPSGRTLPVPLIILTIDDDNVALILDSGSTHHVLTESFAKRHQLPSQGQVQTGEDHASGVVAFTRVGDLDATLNHQKLPLRDVLRMPGPPIFDELGVAGFISPQKLIEDGVIVIDFPARRGFIYPLKRPTDKEIALKHGPFDASASPSISGPYMNVVLNGTAPLVGKLDSGGSITEFLAKDLKVELDGQREGGIAMSAKAVGGLKIAGQQVVAAGTTFSDLTLLAVGDDAAFSQDTHATALVGMDILRHCVLALSAQNQDIARYVCKATKSKARTSTSKPRSKLNQ